MLGGPGRSRSWGTPHTGVPSLPWGQAGAQRWGRSRGSSLTAGVSLSFGTAWWQGTPAGTGLRAAWVMELPPQGHCVPCPLPALPALQLSLAFQGGFLPSTPAQTSPSCGRWGASSGQCGAGAAWDCMQLVHLSALSEESCWAKLLAWLAQAKQDLFQQSGIEAPVLSSRDTHVICRHCSLQGCKCPKQQRE